MALNFFSVIPAKAGIQAQKQLNLDPRVKPEDDKVGVEDDPPTHKATEG